MTDNVILFPGVKRDEAPPQNLDEIHDKVTQTRKEHVAGVMNDMIPDIINMFGAYGVDINDDKYIKDVALVMEGIKALLHRQYNLEHPFHNMSDNIFEFRYNEDSTIEYTYTLPDEEWEIEMIIMDLSQVMISNLMIQLGNHTNADIEEDLLRHMVLNSVRAYNVKFKDEFGEMIIACDAGNNWRRQVFPYYKANRRKNREKSEINWTAVFETLNKVRDELKDYFPYRVIRVDGAEADDIIGTLAQTYGNTNEKILILSGDKDFVQLQAYMNVQQFDPVQKKWRKTNDVDKFIKEHIIRGDTGDGVPNFLSADDTFVVGARQKPISQKKLDQWLNSDPKEFCDEKMLRGYLRNQQLVDLNFIPPDIKKEVLVQYEQQAGKGRDKLFNYFIERRLKLLLESINEF